MKFFRLLITLLLLAAAFYLGSAWQGGRGKSAQAIGTAGKPNSYTPANKPNQREISPAKIITSSEQATIQIFEEASPSVVNITTKRIQQLFNLNELEIPQGSGTGFVWDKEGHIVTNFHVVEGVDNYEITLADRSVWRATYVGSEPNKDLAVLKIDAPAELLFPIKLGSYSDLKVGQAVYAIGNPFGLDHSLSTGIISALGREITSISGRPIRDVIQTDAAINPGNSGGPLLDSSGRLIGVNTMIYSPSGASAGIGFSIPVDVVNWVVPDLVQFGVVKRPVLGVELVPQHYVVRMGFETGAMILSVDVGSGAEQAGLRPIRQRRNGDFDLGDVIIALNGQQIESNNDLILALEQYQPGDQISITYIRDGKKIETEATLGSSIE